MATVTCRIPSAMLGQDTTVEMVLPLGNTPPPVLYLLHGLSDDQSGWLRRTSIERYALTHGLAVVMPCGGRSFYCNMADGTRYWDYIGEELPAFVEHTFQVATGRANTFVAGLSMGGYGALKLALKHPKRYAAAATLSGAFLQDWLQLNHPELYAADFPDTPKFRGSAHDPFVWATEFAQTGQPRPLLFMAAGTDDWLYSQSVELHNHLEKLGFNVKWVSAPGNHDWHFWDTHIQEVLDWLPLKE